ncbi:McrB family protein [Rossellomorea sp. KS-H15a]|uniref:McrB family protein n=1 Tax=Rossellomorea sp. KS-H15a TaxID=2963940 RepID=UPI0020C5C6F9|nr:AAA family ATPase [Rossellomorea sp. KS-H15a]UTE78492.1 AAA family ATPase [Rossellomorea sp. KS-H15a]
MQNKMFEQFFDSFFSKNNIVNIATFTQFKVDVKTDGFLLHINQNKTSDVFIKKNVFLKYFEHLIQNRNISFNNKDEKSIEALVFYMLKLLPFVEAKNNNTIEIRSYRTSDLPGHFNDSMNFLTDQIVHNRELILKSPFFRLIYNLLDHMGRLLPQIKRNILLEIMYLTIKSSTTDTPITESVATRRLGDTLSWLQGFKLIDNNLNVVSRFADLNSSKSVNFWWVNQGQSAKLQIEGGFLWSPKTDKKGTPLAHHNDVMLAQPGDIVFAYSDVAIRSICIVERASEDKPKPSSFSSHSNWEEQGNYLKVLFNTLDQVINKAEIPEQWRKDEDGPFDRKGNVKQGYFYKVSNSFSTKLLNKFKDRLPQEIVNHLQVTDDINDENIRIEIMTFSSDQQGIDHIHSYISNKGFYYERKEIINLYLSLKTKPFVILSGISGTGKTKIVQLFAESLGATTDNGQFALIPVRPDWSDGSDLIGYRDIKGEFQAGPLTKVLMEANLPENRDKPYFLLLDEMNLARVEYYFSDLLSVMESRNRQNGEMVSAPIVEEEEVGKLLLRDNFYIIGTVNMDETTHPFSPKVLDRANTIEYNDVVLDHFGFLTKDSIAEPVAIDNQQMAGRFLNLKDAFFDYEDLVRKVTGLLVEVNTILEPIKAHFGYRVRDEVCFYMIYNDEGQLMKFDDAFDYQLVQKILPRLTGNDLKTEDTLKKLFLFCTSHEWDEMNAASIVKEARFSKSAKKLSNMIPKIMHDGFTSFWGS